VPIGAAKWKKCSKSDLDRTFERKKDEKGFDCIQFKPCGVTSYHSEDIKHAFCAYCDEFMQDVQRARKCQDEIIFEKTQRNLI